MNLKILFLILFFSSFIYCQWITLSPGTSQNLNAIYFFNTQTGFICGAGGLIIKTTNTGQNWLFTKTSTSNELRSIYFVNNVTGLACGNNGTIVRSTNSGFLWMPVNSGTINSLNGVSFFNDMIGIIGGNSGTMLYTTNGGLNWLVGQPEGFLVSFNSAFMVNATTGYVAGVNTIFSPLVGKTTNGGANWTFYSFYLNNNEGTLRDLHFFDAQNGIAVSNVWNGQGGISRTTNGGLNWTSQIVTNALYGVDFPSVQTGYSCGFNGTILKSTDGGNNWSQQTTPNTA